MMFSVCFTPEYIARFNRLCFLPNEWIFMFVDLCVEKNGKLQFDSLKSWPHTRITCGALKKTLRHRPHSQPIRQNLWG